MTKTVIITGATRGIGYVTALAFARTGANVAISGRRADRGAESLAMVWLASDQTSYINGRTIAVDGGHNIKMSVAYL